MSVGVCGGGVEVSVCNRIAVDWVSVKCLSVNPTIIIML